MNGESNGYGPDGHRASPDRELMLRGKPVELPTLQVQLVSPAMLERRQPPSTGGGLREYGHMLARRKWLILGITAAFALIGGLIGLFQTPMYQARTALEVQGPNENFLNQKDMDPAASGGPSSLETYVETQARILQDDALLDKTLTKLKLHQKPELVNAPGPLARVRRSLGLRSPQPSHEAVLSGAVQNLTVRASSQSHIVELSYDAPDPEVAANVANTLADEFIEQNLDNRWKARQRIAKWLSRELETLKGNLEKAADDLRTYARATGLIFNQQESSNVAQDRLRQVQEEFSRAQAERVTRQSKYEMAMKSSPESLPDVLDDGPLRDAQVKLTELRRQMAELNSTFQPGYYKLKNVKAQVAELEAILKNQRANILERIKNEFQAAQRREKLLGRNLQLTNRSSVRSGGHLGALPNVEARGGNQPGAVRFDAAEGARGGYHFGDSSQQHSRDQPGQASRAALQAQSWIQCRDGFDCRSVFEYCLRLCA